jgi:hypothetical protein
MASWIWSRGFENDGTVIGAGWTWTGAPGTENWSLHPERQGRVTAPTETLTTQQLKDISFQAIWDRLQGTTEEKLNALMTETVDYVSTVYWAQRTGKIEATHPVYLQAQTFHAEQQAETKQRRGVAIAIGGAILGGAALTAAISAGSTASAVAAGSSGVTAGGAVTGASVGGAGGAVAASSAASAAGVVSTTGLTATGIWSGLNTALQYGTTALAFARKVGINIGGSPSPSPQMSPRTLPQGNTWDGLINALYPGEIAGAPIGESGNAPVTQSFFGIPLIVIALILFGFGAIVLFRR